MVIFAVVALHSQASGKKYRWSSVLFCCAELSTDLNA